MGQADAMATSRGMSRTQIGGQCVIVALCVTLCAAVDECMLYKGLCDSEGQLCVDPDFNKDKDWECTCPVYMGFAPDQPSKALGAATCARVGPCNATSACSDQGQACRNNADNSFSCFCTPPRSCYAHKAAATVVQLDECAGECTTCADKGLGNVCFAAGQSCNDPNKDVASTGDWECLCLYPSDTKATGAAVAACQYVASSECATLPDPCGGAGAVKSGCIDFTPNATGYACQCTGAHAASATVYNGAATCDSVDECADVCPTCADSGAGNLCGVFGQTCTDANTSASSLRDWRCECIGFKSKTGTGAQAPAECEYTGTCADMYCGPDQYCMNDISDSFYHCVCAPPATGVRISSGATCTLDECAGRCRTCEEGLCGRAGQTCVDDDLTTLGTWECVCADGSARSVGEPAECAVVGSCAASGETCFQQGQDCSDAAAGFACECLAPNVGGARANEAAVCERDECAADGVPAKICSGASQTCVDPVQTAAGDWLCACAGGAVGARVGSPTASCVYNECFQAGGDVVCGAAGQTCEDPDPRPETKGDWVCRCAGAAVARAGAPVTPRVPAACDVPRGDSCEVRRRFCSGARQVCAVANPGQAADWACQCLRSNDSSVSAVVRTCVFDECSDAANKAACAAAGQTCIDLNTAETSLGDWYCKCATSTGMALRAPASCVLPGCVANWDVCARQKAECVSDSSKKHSFTCACDGGAPPTSLGACVYPSGNECGANAGTCNGASGGVFNQRCRDNNVGASGDWECVCLPPFTGSSVASAASCVLDECTAVCKGCADEGAGNICTKVGQLCADDNTSVQKDWYCKCDTAGGKGTGSGNKAAPVLTERLASCVIDECVLNRATCDAEGQTCLDPNVDAAVKGDWICMCPDKTATKTAGVATCGIETPTLSATLKLVAASTRTSTLDPPTSTATPTMPLSTPTVFSTPTAVADDGDGDGDNSTATPSATIIPPIPVRTPTVSPTLPGRTTPTVALIATATTTATPAAATATATATLVADANVSVATLTVTAAEGSNESAATPTVIPVDDVTATSTATAVLADPVTTPAPATAVPTAIPTAVPTAIPTAVPDTPLPTAVPSDDDGLSGGAVAGIVAGGCVVVAAALSGVWWYNTRDLVEYSAFVKGMRPEHELLVKRGLQDYL